MNSLFVQLPRTFTAPFHTLSRTRPHQCFSHSRICAPSPHHALIRSLANQPTAALKFTASRTSYDAPPTPPLLKFLSSRIWNATHKSVSRVSARGRAPPVPRGSPQGPSQDFWRRLRQRINSVPGSYMFWGILALNGAVFVCWNIARGVYESSRDPSMYIWMRNNFTVSWTNVKSGRIWTLLTSCISHEDLMHAIFNVMGFYFMAPPVISMLGNVGFLALYLGSGLVSSLSSLYWHTSIKNHPNYNSHGASGAIYGVISFFACVAPTTQFLLFFIIPMPAWACVTGIFLWDSYSAYKEKRATTDTAGHVGGLLAGALFFLGKRFRVF